MSLMAGLVELTLGVHHIADMSIRVKYPSDTHVNTQHVGNELSLYRIYFDDDLVRWGLRYRTKFRP